MILSWTFLLIAIASIIAVLALRMVYLTTLLPLMSLEFYKKQGMKTVFMPLARRFELRLKDTLEKGDFYAEEKNQSRTNPDQKIMAFTLGSEVMICVQGVEYMKDLLMNPSAFVKSKWNDVFRPLLGNGILFIEGEKWKLHRKLISTCFHYEFIHSNVKLIQDTTKEFLDKIEPTEYSRFLIMFKFLQITGEVVGRIFFGRSLNRYTFEGKPMTLALADLITELTKVTRTPLYLMVNTKIFMLPLQKYRRLAKRVAEFRALCFKIIQDRKKETGDYNDLLDALLTQQRNTPADSDERLSDEDIMNEFITFFMAGMDTTGRLATMVLYCLTQNPECLVKVREEQIQTYETESEVTVETIQKMNWLNCVIKETLRHYCPASSLMYRETVKDFTLMDIKIKKGTLVRTDPFALFFDETVFEEPHQFKPERWQTPNSKMSPFSFIPFSGGPRNCIGQHLAILEAKIIVSEFMKRFDFKVSEGYKLKMMGRFLYEPFDPLPMDLVKRQ